jgi:hypothetical protein
MLVIILIFTLNAVLSHTAAQTCLEKALQLSQDCSNTHLMYFSNEGLASGFGSEFNHYLIYVFLDSIYSNQRAISVRTSDEWPYDCTGHLGWGCYLELGCEDSILKYLPYLQFREGNSFHDKGGVEHDINGIQRKLSEAYSKHYHLTNCDERVLTISEITSIVANYVFKLNKESQTFVNEFNSYYNLESKKYVSVQIRTTDKHAEMEDVTWSFINNMTRVMDTVMPYLVDTGIYDIFIGTDNCDLLKEIADLPNFKDKGYILHSACFHGNPFTQGNPQRGSYGHTLRLISEIEMLVHGDIFFGVLQSNLVRMVYRLRYPVKDKFVPFTYEDIHKIWPNYDIDMLTD